MGGREANHYKYTRPDRPPMRPSTKGREMRMPKNLAGMARRGDLCLLFDICLEPQGRLSSAPGVFDIIFLERVMGIEPTS